VTLTLVDDEISVLTAVVVFGAVSSGGANLINVGCIGSFPSAVLASVVEMNGCECDSSRVVGVLGAVEKCSEGGAAESTALRSMSVTTTDGLPSFSLCVCSFCA
jgi:hypothetical protein